jgi:molecular chaperone DnaK
MPGADDTIIGIDLGTTNSTVGVVDSGFPILLADMAGLRLTPSVVFFPPGGGDPVVGRAALQAREQSPGRVVASAKRLIGTRLGEVADPGRLRVAGRPGEPVKIALEGGDVVSPEEVAAQVLTHLKRVAESRLGHPVRRAVVTVPAYFNDAQRSATKRAAGLAGLAPERILSEPTAAALAYGLDRLGEHSKVAVYDLGGGTFDISVLELSGGVFEVLATHGDTRLGGDDLDAAVAAWLRRAVGERFPGWTPDPDADRRLLAAAERAKVALSHADAVTVPFVVRSGDGRDVGIEIGLDRATFDQVTAPVIRRTVSHCRQALADAGLASDDLDAVVLVGGATRVPAVRALVAEVFGRPPDTSQHPDEAVGIGAVIQAGILSGAVRDVVLLDVTPLSLGIETFGGLMNVIIPRNSTIPAKAGEMFTNAVAGQREMLVRVLQGERELADDNWELGQLVVPFVPGPKGSARVGVQFRIDADGILEVLARDTATARDTVLEIRGGAVDVADSAVARMIDSSIDHAFADMEARRAVELRLKAYELLTALDQALDALGDSVGHDELAEIRHLADALREASPACGNPGPGEETGGRQLRALESALEALELATEPLAARLIERALEER